MCVCVWGVICVRVMVNNWPDSVTSIVKVSDYSDLIFSAIFILFSVIDEQMPHYNLNPKAGELVEKICLR